LLALLPVALVGIGYGLLGFLRRPDLIDLHVIPGETIRVTGRWFGIPLRRRSWWLDDITELRVVHCKEYYTKLALKPARPAGLVSLITGASEIRPLSKTLLFGTEVHDRTADALAALIGCEVRRIGRLGHDAIASAHIGRHLAQPGPRVLVRALDAQVLRRVGRGAGFTGRGRLRLVRG
jgi:hypothetical protein